MKVFTTGFFLFPLLLPCACSAPPGEPQEEPDSETTRPETGPVRPGWRLGVQAWSFRKYTFYEAAAKAASIGLGWIEAYPGQPLARGRKAAFHHAMPADTRREVLDRLDKLGVKLVNYGVVGLPADEKGCRALFDFARAMGIETIVSEPPPDRLDLVEKLCEEYGIGLAIHNHPKPSLYWHPGKVAAALRGRSPLLGACADTGHWMRSGLDPLEGMRILEGRIRSFHFKDRSAFGPEAKDIHDVPWGTGKGRAAELLAEARRQGFRGTFIIEYEYNWERSLPEIAACAAFFRREAAKLPEPPFRPLLPQGLASATLKPGAWTLEEGVLARRGGGFLWTRERYRNFVLTGEFKFDPKANSGVFLRTADRKNWLHTGIEMQVLDSHGKKKPGKHDCGAIYDIQAPSANAVKPAGQWNNFRITAIGPRLEVELNGVRVVRVDLDLWTEAHRNPDGTRNKFDRPYAELDRKGHIGFQDHGNPVWYRNLAIKPYS